MNRRIATLLTLLAVFASSASADVFMTIGNYLITPNGPNGTNTGISVPIYASGDTLVDGMSFNLQVGDAPENGANHATPYVFGDVNLTTGTIWGATATVSTLPGQLRQLKMYGVEPPTQKVQTGVDEFGDPVYKDVVIPVLTGDGSGGPALVGTATIKAPSTVGTTTYDLPGTHYALRMMGTTNGNSVFSIGGGNRANLSAPDGSVAVLGSRSSTYDVAVANALAASSLDDMSSWNHPGVGGWWKPDASIVLDASADPGMGWYHWSVTYGDKLWTVAGVGDQATLTVADLIAAGFPRPTTPFGYEATVMLTTMDSAGTYGQSTSSLVVPEPVSMSLLAFGAVGLLLRRRRR
jgi:hypothetical protein